MVPINGAAANVEKNVTKKQILQCERSLFILLEHPTAAFVFSTFACTKHKIAAVLLRVTVSILPVTVPKCQRPVPTNLDETKGGVVESLSTAEGPLPYARSRQEWEKATASPRFRHSRMD